MVKKIFLAFIVATLLVVPSAGAEGIYQLVASGPITQANARISAAATAAFFDTPDAALGAVLQAKKGHLLKIRDSAGRAIQGYIKAAGSAETLDVNLHTNADFASDEPPGTAWTKGTGITITGGKLTFALTSSQVARQTFSLPVGGLYKWGFDLSSYVSGTGMNYYFATIDIGQIQTVPASYSGYRTSALGSATYYGMSGRGTLNGTGDNVYLQKVLTPSATGVTISSTKGGTALDNWAQKDAAFNYNDASGYTYEIWKVNNSVVVASGTVTAGNGKVDLTDTNAFAEFGVDLATPGYQDGKHILALYNTTGGYAAVGWISGTAPGGETLGVEINTGTLSISNLYNITATEVNHFGTGLIVGSYFTSNGTETCDANNKVKNVTDVATTGALILGSDKLTRTWIYKHASFNPNAEFTYKVLYVGD